jgi:hypothetical protein
MTVLRPGLREEGDPVRGQDFQHGLRVGVPVARGPHAFDVAEMGHRQGGPLAAGVRGEAAGQLQALLDVADRLAEPALDQDADLRVDGSGLERGPRVGADRVLALGDLAEPVFAGSPSATTSTRLRAVEPWAGEEVRPRSSSSSPISAFISSARAGSTRRAGAARVPAERSRPRLRARSVARRLRADRPRPTPTIRADTAASRLRPGHGPGRRQPHPAEWPISALRGGTGTVLRRGRRAGR